MFASACLRLISANAATLRSSRRKSCTTDIPVMFSCRKALMRAIHLRTSRKEVRDPRRNQFVTTKKSGITAKVTRARRQFIHTMTPMIPNSVNRSPNTVTTPEVKSSFTASTSVVTRVIRRPTGFLSK